MTADPTTVSVEVGKTVKVAAKVAPDDAAEKSVTYKSSDDTKATVAADGTITGVAAGSATITITTKDGGKTATCAVTVTPPAAG
ncbi:Ig-like domain-containing protein [Lacticaseibacillus sp. GG6-2]